MIGRNALAKISHRIETWLTGIAGEPIIGTGQTTVHCIFALIASGCKKIIPAATSITSHLRSAGDTICPKL
jgi:hypothetical protein